ncbi:MAG: hypothetical protein AD742_17760 [Methylibium sp. NZG]|nr:MAG: hypothetical protein AD742_17760 [Methylibium sp. NZG]
MFFMTGSQIAAVAVAAVLLFWAVGAYNRLMQLRNAILRRFVPLAEQLDVRHALLTRQLDALTPRLPEHADAVSAVRSACSQAQAAAALARAHPGATGALNSLRLAEDILLDARTRLPTEPAAVVEAVEAVEAAEAAEATHEAHQALVEPPSPDFGTQIAAAELALQFARTRFNDSVTEYNRAVQQFPTWVLARLFGFKAASTL